ncbi:methyltetrahydrofolate--corrinoid methyltransferase [Capsulimonas corticalis]|uniref:Methyltetrahydrofolate--corrinoid methyltransferase n=1 Tax=Capsulimonas corticalis TaxID=2219043 RepID=A0A402CQ74_9BACT|nr:dihydropteroate synthase [Capsulimonas corticalis]BDI32759.1 methyltetrahydrofolate--corrinoid methyltransferase [Capsulimonas corticalis]
MISLPELIVGQRINSSSKSVADALRSRDAAFLQTLARSQAASGARALDINVSAACARAEEPELLSWAANAVQEVSDLPLCLDSGDVCSLADAGRQCRVAPIVNSLSPDQIDDGALDRFDLRRPGQRFVVLCTRRDLAMDAASRLSWAEYAANRLFERGVSEEALIFDPLMFPLPSGAAIAEATFETMRGLRERWPNAGILCAAGNYSHGMRRRSAAERECIRLARSAGADVFLCDPAVFVSISH